MRFHFPMLHLGHALFLTAISFLAMGNAGAASPQGFITVPINVSTDGLTYSVTQFSAPLQPAATITGSAAGTITSLGSSTISNSAAGWSASSLSLSSSPYFIKITSGTAEGRIFLITANTSTSLTVDTKGLNLTSLGIFTGSGGDTYEIFPGYTLLSLLGTPANGVIGGTSTQFAANTTDKVLLNNSTGITQFYYYDTTASQWRESGSTVNQNNLPLSPFIGFAYYRLGTSPLNLTFLGAAPSTDARVQIPTSGTTMFATYYAASTTLRALGIETSVAWRKFGDAGVTLSDTDRVLIEDSFHVLRSYYFDTSSSSWKRPGSSVDQGGASVLPGTTIYFVRYGSGADETWVRPLPYNRFLTAAPLSISSSTPGSYVLSWATINQRKYQLESSTDMFNWTSFGSQVTGSGSTATTTDTPVSTPKKFYRLRSGAIRPGYDRYNLPKNDDGSTGLIPLGFSINLFGTSYNSCYVNNNGNITFQNPLPTYTPDVLHQLGIPIIAAFWADVDTRTSGSDTIRYSYGTETINGHPTFGVNYINVGYYANHTDKLNRFQLVLIDRSDTGTGNFDVEFNYDQIQWEAGDFSGGTAGLGGTVCRVGISNGSDQTIEIAHSGETLKFLDKVPSTGLPNPTGLIFQTRNSSIPGSLVFPIRSGNLSASLHVDAGPDQHLFSNETSTTLTGTASDSNGGGLTYLWTQVSGPPGAVFSNPTSLSTTVTLPPDDICVFQLTATSTVDPQISASDTVTVEN